MNRTSKIVVVLATFVLGAALALPTSVASASETHAVAGPTWCC